MRRSLTASVLLLTGRDAETDSQVDISLYILNIYCSTLVHWSIICLRASYEDANAAIDTDLRFPPFIFEIC